MADNSPNEDLFDSSRMSFGQHLDELRKVLVKALIGVALGCIIGFYFANQIVALLNQPLIEALVQFKNDRARERLVAREGFVPPELLPWLDKEKMAPEQIYVDPGQLVNILREVSPDFLSGIQLDPYRFKSKHLDASKLDELCSLWLSSKSGDDPIGQQHDFLWNALTPTEQASITRISNVSQPNDQDVTQVAAILGRLMSEQRLFEENVFQPELSETTKGWLGWLSLSGQPNPLGTVKANLESDFNSDVNERLNRVLITTLFQNQMPEVRLDMLPLQIWRSLNVKPQSLNPTESFLIWIKAGLIAGLLISSPWVLYQIWSFVASGLYPHEKKHVHIFLPTSLILFFSGAALAFFFVFQPVLAFLFTFNAQMGIEPQPRINEWLSFVLFLPLGFGIAFQLPLVMLFMNRINVLSIETYLSKWRIAVMVIFVLSMILTPADPVSMILLAAPLTCLYFFGICLCYWFPNKANPFEPLPEP